MIRIGDIIEYNETKKSSFWRWCFLNSNERRSEQSISGLYFVVSDVNKSGQILLINPNGELIREQAGFILNMKEFVIHHG